MNSSTRAVSGAGVSAFIEAGCPRFSHRRLARAIVGDEIRREGRYTAGRPRVATRGRGGHRDYSMIDHTFRRRWTFLVVLAILGLLTSCSHSGSGRLASLSGADSGDHDLDGRIETLQPI